MEKLSKDNRRVFGYVWGGENAVTVSNLDTNQQVTLSPEEAISLRDKLNKELPFGPVGIIETYVFAALKCKKDGGYGLSYDAVVEVLRAIQSDLLK